MPNDPTPDQIVKSIRSALLQEAREDGMFIELHRTQPSSKLSQDVRKDLHNDAELKQTYFQAAETGQSIRKRRGERES